MGSLDLGGKAGKAPLGGEWAGVATPHALWPLLGDHKDLSQEPSSAGTWGSNPCSGETVCSTRHSPKKPGRDGGYGLAGSSAQPHTRSLPSSRRSYPMWRALWPGYLSFWSTVRSLEPIKDHLPNSPGSCGLRSPVQNGGLLSNLSPHVLNYRTTPWTV